VLSRSVASGEPDNCTRKYAPEDWYASQDSGLLFLQREKNPYMDAPAVERLVKGVIVEFGLPCELQRVALSGDQWEISIVDTARRVQRFRVYNGTATSMRTSIKAHLDDLLD
jgi:hypothetical protein